MRRAAAGCAVAFAVVFWPAAAQAAPPNDNFASAELLSGAHDSVIGDNIAATKEPLEPNHAGNAGGASVWYRWTAPATNPVHIDACYALDSLLAVYTGNSVSGLTEVVSNDDAGCGGPGGVGSVVDFTAQAGTMYRIAIDGFNGAQGEVRFTLHQHDPYPQCQDGADNDGDSLVDAADPGCWNADDNSEDNVLETPPPPESEPSSARAVRRFHFRLHPARVRVVPSCDEAKNAARKKGSREPGRYKGQVRLFRLLPDGSRVGGRKATRFRCLRGKAKSKGYLRLKRSWWRRARTAKGVTLIAQLSPRGEGSEAYPTETAFTLRRKSRRERRSPSATASSVSSYHSIFRLCVGGGGLYANEEVLSVEHDFNGAGIAGLGEWVRVVGWARVFYPYHGFSSWFQSSIASYPVGNKWGGYATTFNGLPGFVVGGFGAAGSTGGGEDYLHWWYSDGRWYKSFTAPPGTYVQMAVSIYTPRTGWRFVDTVTPSLERGAQRYDDYCYYP